VLRSLSHVRVCVSHSGLMILVCTEREKGRSWKVYDVMMQRLAHSCLLSIPVLLILTYFVSAAPEKRKVEDRKCKAPQGCPPREHNAAFVHQRRF